MSVDVYSGAQLSDSDSSPVSSVCPIEAPVSEAQASEAQASEAPETEGPTSVSASDTLRPTADADTDAAPEHDPRRERLAPALALIDAHLAEDLPVARAARTVAMSPSHFRRYFKQVVGQSYVRYVHRRRIDRACELIANTDLSLYQIAIEVGFCDQSYFGLVFRRLLHTTPAAYRRKFRTDPNAPRETTPPESESRSGSGSVVAA
jgi:transcriptional regulator GlxA family with amidase domain